jgi:hypothetical protein
MSKHNRERKSLWREGIQKKQIGYKMENKDIAQLKFEKPFRNAEPKQREVNETNKMFQEPQFEGISYSSKMSLDMSGEE